jgi:formate dehydrogenase subunit gamma
MAISDAQSIRICGERTITRALILRHVPCSPNLHFGDTKSVMTEARPAAVSASKLAEGAQSRAESPSLQLPPWCAEQQRRACLDVRRCGEEGPWCARQGILGRFRAAPAPLSQCADRLPASPDTIRRFVTAERLLHWAIAIPFLGCFVSAVVLVAVYNPDPTRAYRYFFAWMHRACGTGLVVCPSLVLLATMRRHWHIHLYNVRQAWVWRFDDIKWLTLMGPATLSKRIILPDQGKFNAAEKLNFMMVMLFPPLFIASGVLIWFPDATALGSFFPWVVHFALVALATPVVLGHVIMATINPSTRVGLTGMFSGFVSREWAAHHYARWFREQFPHLEHEHAGEATHDADVMMAADAGSELGAQPTTVAVDQLPLETIEEQSPVSQPSPAASLLPWASVTETGLSR